MTEYNSAAVSDSVISHQKGITLQQGRALRDNALAMQWLPFDGGADGVVWDFATDGATATITTDVFEDDFEYMLVGQRIGYSSTGSVSDVDFYRGTSATWENGAAEVNASTTTTPADSFVVKLYRANQSLRFHVMEMSVLNAALTDTFGAPTLTTSYITHSTAQKITRMRLVLSGGGNFNSGALYLLKRVCPA